MGKKIALMVFAGIAVIGLLVTIVGYAMGGRQVNLATDDGQVVLRSAGQKKVLGTAPRNWNNSRLYFFGGSWDDWDYDYDDHYDDDDDYDDDDYVRYSGDENGSATSIGAGAATVANQGVAHSIEVDISAGYITLKPGDTASLAVEGPLEYTSDIRDGVMKIVSDERVNRISRSSDDWKGRPRFIRDGVDITTEFIITVPRDAMLDVELSMGAIEGKDLVLSQGEFSIDIGLLEIQNSSAIKSSFEADLGAVEVKGFKGETTSLKANLGSVSFEGDIATLLEADCELGAIEATLPRPENYGYSAETSLGAISIDGHGHASLGGSAHQGDHNQKPFYDLECELGAIEIKFK